MTARLTRRKALLGGLCLGGLGIGAGAAALAIRATSHPPLADVRSVTWMDLMPEAELAAWEEMLSQGPTSEMEWQQLEVSRADDPWQPVPQMNLDAQPRPELDGENIALAGYMTPLEFDARETRSFLLVPYVGACIHVPAPPPNQIVLVESENPVPILDLWQPFVAVGTMRIERQDTGLAESSYVMALNRMVALELAGGPADTGEY